MILSRGIWGRDQNETFQPVETKSQHERNHARHNHPCYRLNWILGSLGVICDLTGVIIGEPNIGAGIRRGSKRKLGVGPMCLSEFHLRYLYNATKTDRAFFRCAVIFSHFHHPTRLLLRRFQSTPSLFFGLIRVPMPKRSRFVAPSPRTFGAF